MSFKMKVTPKGAAVVALMDEHARKLGVDPQGLWMDPIREKDRKRVMASMKADPTYAALKGNGIVRGGGEA